MSRTFVQVVKPIDAMNLLTHGWREFRIVEAYQRDQITWRLFNLLLLKSMNAKHLTGAFSTGYTLHE